MKNDYLERVNIAYQDEVGGEAFFGALSELLDDPEQSYKMRVIARLELETKECARPLVEKLGGNPEEDPKEREDGVKEAAEYASKSWEELMTALKDDLPAYITWFKELEAMGDAHGAEDMEILIALTTHEEVMLIFAERELAGQTDRSLEPIIEVLDKVPARG